MLENQVERRGSPSSPKYARYLEDLRSSVARLGLTLIFGSHIDNLNLSVLRVCKSNASEQVPWQSVLVPITGIDGDYPNSDSRYASFFSRKEGQCAHVYTNLLHPLQKSLMIFRTPPLEPSSANLLEEKVRLCKNLQEWSFFDNGHGNIQDTFETLIKLKKLVILNASEKTIRAAINSGLSLEFLRIRGLQLGAPKALEHLIHSQRATLEVIEISCNYEFSGFWKEVPRNQKKAFLESLRNLVHFLPTFVGSGESRVRTLSFSDFNLFQHMNALRRALEYPKLTESIKNVVPLFGDLRKYTWANQNRRSHSPSSNRSFLLLHLQTRPESIRLLLYVFRKLLSPAMNLYLVIPCLHLRFNGSWAVTHVDICDDWGCLFEIPPSYLIELESLNFSTNSVVNDGRCASEFNDLFVVFLKSSWNTLRTVRLLSRVFGEEDAHVIECRLRLILEECKQVSWLCLPLSLPGYLAMGESCDAIFQRARSLSYLVLIDTADDIFFLKSFSRKRLVHHACNILVGVCWLCDQVLPLCPKMRCFHVESKISIMSILPQDRGSIDFDADLASVAEIMHFLGKAREGIRRFQENNIHVDVRSVHQLISEWYDRLIWYCDLFVESLPSNECEGSHSHDLSYMVHPVPHDTPSPGEDAENSECIQESHAIFAESGKNSDDMKEHEFRKSHLLHDEKRPRCKDRERDSFMFRTNSAPCFDTSFRILHENDSEYISEVHQNEDQINAELAKLTANIQDERNPKMH